jgi:hypothetical protein
MHEVADALDGFDHATLTLENRTRRLGPPSASDQPFKPLEVPDPAQGDVHRLARCQRHHPAKSSPAQPDMRRAGANLLGGSRITGDHKYIVEVEPPCCTPPGGDP